MSKETYVPSGNTYDIVTIEQLFNVITPENLPFLLADLVKCSHALFALRDIQKISAPNTPAFTLSNFKWIDDGKNDIGAIILKSPLGEEFIINDETFKSKE